MLTPIELIAFESKIADAFNAAKIRAPVHLHDGCEEQLIEIFKDVRPQDWVCSNWRSHYHCLLKGVPPDELEAEIMAGRSISLCFPRQRVICSAMVGGILPIAIGIAYGIKRRGDPERVWAFMGDMTRLCGAAHECIMYAANHELPVTWVVERNDKSVCTVTSEVWGACRSPDVREFTYESRYPHAGAGQRVNF